MPTKQNSGESWPGPQPSCSPVWPRVCMCTHKFGCLECHIQLGVDYLVYYIDLRPALTLPALGAFQRLGFPHHNGWPGFVQYICCQTPRETETNSTRCPFMTSGMESIITSWKSSKCTWYASMNSIRHVDISSPGDVIIGI